MSQAIDFDSGRFGKIPREDFVGAYLAKQSGRTSLGTIMKRLSRFFEEDEDAVSATLSAMSAAGSVEREGEYFRLSTSARKRFTNFLGRDIEAQWSERILTLRFPMIALNLDPEDRRARGSLHSTLVPRIVAVAAGFPSEIWKTDEVRSELIWRLLRRYLPREILGKDALPIIKKSGPLERKLLSGLAGCSARSVPEAFKAVAAQAVGAKNWDADSLRLGLVKRGLTLSVGQTAVTSGVAFSNRVLDVARSLTHNGGGPYGPNVPISEVYDRYGRDYPDAGSLDAFKNRIVKAAAKGSLALARLDLPQALGRDVRERSATRYRAEELHYIDTTENSSHA